MQQGLAVDARASRTVVVAALACVAACAATAEELHDARTVVDEIVADNTTRFPLRKVAASIPFENFRYPFVDDAENVLFIGNDTYTYRARQQGGVFRSAAAGGRIDAMVLESDPAPDDGKPMGLILGLQTDRRSFVIHRGPDRGTGIYARFGDGPLTTVAGLATPAPQAGSAFGWFWYADIHDNRVVFHGTPASSTQPAGGLYLYDHDTRRLRRLVDSTTGVPAAGGARLADPSYQPRIDGSWLVFSANRLDADGSVRPGRGILGWRLDTAGETADPFDIGRLEILAPFGMEIPHSGGRRLTAAPNPVVHGGIVAVIAGHSDDDPFNERTAWQSVLVRTPDGVWHAPLDTNTLIPGREENGCFTGFNKWPAVEDGRVLCIARGPGGYEAVYLHDPAEKRLYFVADTDFVVDGKNVSGFEIGRYPMVGRRLAMLIRFRDGTSGVYLSTLEGLPEHRVRRR